jgi:membrane-associated protease RseP (regulator of RpoE activity)
MDHDGYSSRSTSSVNWEHIPRDDSPRARAFVRETQIGDTNLETQLEPSQNLTWADVKWPLILFVATCASTYYVQGLVYSIAIMTILLCHEFGHYIQSRRYRVKASLPYCIPMPAPPLGTMGAVISMKSQIPNRKALFDIGISGPLAGLVPALICTIAGLSLSDVQKIPPRGYFVFGDPLIIKWITSWFFAKPPEGHDIFLHPLALAGWGGIFITALNLIPIGQLDGGHILYAILRRWSYPITTLLLYGVLAAMVLTGAYGWIIMVILLVMSGPLHPPTQNDSEPLGRGRTILGWATLSFIIIGFTPVPISVM